MESYFNRSLSGPPFERDEEKKYEFCRYVSFKDWPSECPIFPSDLARAGFYATGNSDEVACYVCGARKSDWKFGDNTEVIHREMNGECPFFTEGFEDNIPISASVVIGNEISNNQRLCDLDRLLDCENMESFRSEVEAINRNRDQIASTDDVAITRNEDQNDDQTRDQTSTAAGQSGAAGNFSGTSAPTVSSGQNPRLPSNSQGQGQRTMPKSRSSDSISSTARSAGAATNVTDAERDNASSSNTRADKRRNQNKGQGQDIPPPTGAAIGPLRFERNRLGTFKKWPSGAKVSAADLAKSGFTYTGSGDRVQCVFCKGILRNWEEGDRPHIEHRKHFPRCPLVLGIEKGNVPLPPGQTTRRQSSGPNTPIGSHQVLNQNVVEGGTNMESLGISTDRPKHVQFAIEAQRVGSFHNWPAYKHQTPQQLAEAGFFYAGFSDNVKCFYCNGGLRNWEKGDDPWHEHARWFPTCRFVLNVKGQDYVNAVRVENQDAPILAQARRNAEGSTIAEHPVRHEVEEREVKARMDRAHVKVVEEMGVKRDLIMSCIRKRLLETGDDFPSATALLEAVFLLEEEQARGHVTQTGTQLTDQNNATADCEELEPVDKQEGEQKTNKGEDDTGNQVKRSSSVPEGLTNNVDLLKENTELKEQRLCKICMVADANMVFLPCGHLVSCAACSPALQFCPICRAAIKGSVRTYMS